MVKKAPDGPFALFDGMSDGVCVAEAGGRFLYMNEAARRLLEVPADEVASRSACALLCERLQAHGGWEAGRDCPLRRPGEQRSMSFSGRHGPHDAFAWNEAGMARLARWKDVRVRCARTTLSWGGPRREVHLVLLEDAGPEMELKRQRADWRAMIAHDLRGPLTGVFAGLKLLEEIHPAIPAGDQDATLVHASLSSCRKMMELLDLYLEVARLDSDTVKPKLEAVDLAALAADALDGQRLLAAERGVTLRCAVAAGLKARADAGLLARVAANLVDNAVKYNVPGGTVTVSAAAADGQVRLSFADTGRGIAAEDLPRIFDRYYQAEARRAGRIRGNGLGLTFCKEALRLMGGTIAAASESGRGTEFVVTLPMAGA